MYVEFKAIGWYIVVQAFEANQNTDESLSPFIMSLLVGYLYEAQEEADCGSLLRGSVFSATTGVDCFALGWCVAVNRYAFKVRLLFVFVNGAEMVEMLVCGLKSKGQVQGSIEELSFTDSPIMQEGVAHLKEMPHKVLQQISVLHLTGCELDGTALDLLSDIIPIMTSLKYLDIFKNPAGNGGTVKLLQALGNLHSLHTLEMHRTNIGCDDIMALSQLIRPTGCLKKLSIGDWNMPPECVELMMKTVLSTSSLEDLTVRYVDLTSCWIYFHHYQRITISPD